MRYFLELAYCGKAYNGWQAQPGAPSVQQTLQDALSVILRKPVGVVGAGRTDTGVHASFYTAHFDTDAVIADRQQFCYHLNAILPDDIAVSGLKRVRDDAHARFDAVEREYKYYVSTVKDPFSTGTAFRLTLPLDIAAMNGAAALLLEQSDFTSFCKLHSDNKTNICHVRKAYWEVDGKKLVFTISADRFLRNMVRAIVGTLLDVGRGKLDITAFAEITAGRNRSLAGTSAPAHGLFLTRVIYPADIYLDEKD